MQGVLLVGGKSTRMGTPKHQLIRPNGETMGLYLEKLLLQACQRPPLIVGTTNDDVPWSSGTRLEDDPRAKGPMAGILAAMAQCHDVPLLVLAVDFPKIRLETLRWVQEQARDTRVACWPKLPQRPFGEPLVAVYFPAAKAILEAAIEHSSYSLVDALPPELRFEPDVPHSMASHFMNANTPEEWRLATHFGHANQSNHLPATDAD